MHGAATGHLLCKAHSQYYTELFFLETVRTSCLKEWTISTAASLECHRVTAHSHFRALQLLHNLSVTVWQHIVILGFCNCYITWVSQYDSTLWFKGSVTVASLQCHSMTAHCIFRLLQLLHILNVTVWQHIVILKYYNYCITWVSLCDNTLWF